MPSIITSSHGPGLVDTRTNAKASPAQDGAGDRRTASRTASMNPIWTAGATITQNPTSRAVITLPLRPHLLDASEDRRARRAPDGREPHQRHDIGDNEGNRRGNGQGQGAVERSRFAGQRPLFRNGDSAPSRRGGAGEFAAAGRNRGRQSDFRVWMSPGPFLGFWPSTRSTTECGTYWVCGKTAISSLRADDNVRVGFFASRRFGVSWVRNELEKSFHSGLQNHGNFSRVERFVNSNFCFVKGPNLGLRVELETTKSWWYFCILKCADSVIYQIGSRTDSKGWQRKNLFGMLPDL